MATLDTLPLPTATQIRTKQSPPPPNMVRATGGQPLAPPANTTWTQPPVPGGVNAPVPTKPLLATGSQPLTPGVPAPQSTSFLGNQQQGVYTRQGDEAGIVNNYLNQFLGADSALMRNARTTGLETAASRGLANSSIAAGAAQRAALDAALPLVSEALGTFNQRENRQWQTGERLGQQQWQTGERQGTQEWQGQQDQRQREWTSSENRLDRDQQITMTQLQDWANNQSFMREFNANLAMMPVQNATQLMNAIAQQALDNPEVYTPDIISGLTEFFTTNYLDVLSRYFPNLYNSTGGG